MLIAALLLSERITVAGQFATRPPLLLRFGLEPARTLPGIPVSLKFTFTNPTAAAIPVPRRLIVLIDEDSPSDNDWRVTDLQGWSNDFVPPYGRLVREIVTQGDLAASNWTSDPRLQRPGIYELHACFVTGRIPPKDFRRESIASTATLEVQEPHGLDADAWKEIRASCPGRFLWSLGDCISRNNGIIGRIVRDDPRSTYAGWLATMLIVYGIDDAIPLLRDWLAQAPEDEYTDWRRLLLAEWEVRLSDGYRSQQPELSKEQTTAAREVLTSLIRNTKIDAVRARAQSKLKDLDEPDED